MMWTSSPIHKITIAPIIESIRPAGWKGAPSAGFENNLASKPPTIDPISPMMIHAIQLAGTCITDFAIKPAMKPIMIYQRKCNIVFT